MKSFAVAINPAYSITLNTTTQTTTGQYFQATIVGALPAFLSPGSPCAHHCEPVHPCFTRIPGNQFTALHVGEGFHGRTVPSKCLPRPPLHRGLHQVACFVQTATAALL